MSLLQHSPCKRPAFLFNLELTRPAKYSLGYKRCLCLSLCWNFSACESKGLNFLPVFRISCSWQFTEISVPPQQPPPAPLGFLDSSGFLGGFCCQGGDVGGRWGSTSPQHLGGQAAPWLLSPATAVSLSCSACAGGTLNAEIHPALVKSANLCSYTRREFKSLYPFRTGHLGLVTGMQLSSDITLW